MKQQEKEVQEALGTLSVKARHKLFEENALKGVNKIFDRSITYEEFVNMKMEDWEDVAQKMEVEMEKVMKVFNTYRKGDAFFQFVYNTTFSDDWSHYYISLESDDSEALFDESVDFIKGKLYEALGIDSTIIGILATRTRLVSRVDWFQINRDT